MQIQLTGFLDKDTASFCKELWNLCLSAQSSPQGVPKELLEAKKLELMQEKVCYLVLAILLPRLTSARLMQTRPPKSCVFGGKPKSAETENLQIFEKESVESEAFAAAAGTTGAEAAVVVGIEHTKIAAEASVEAAAGP